MSKRKGRRGNRQTPGERNKSNASSRSSQNSRTRQESSNQDKLGKSAAPSNEFPALGASAAHSNEFPALGNPVRSANVPSYSGTSKPQVVAKQTVEADNLKIGSLTIKPQYVSKQKSTLTPNNKDSDFQESAKDIKKKQTDNRPLSSDSVTSKSNIKVEFAKEASPEKGNTVRVVNGEFPAKKSKGTLGRPIQLKTNHYQLVLKKPLTVYQYDIDVNKKIENQSRQSDKLSKNKDLMKEMFIKLKQLLPPACRNKLIYNFSKNLYSLGELPFGDSKTYQMNLDNDDFEVTIKPINTVYMDPGNKDQPQTISLMDLICTHTFNFTCLALNRSFFPKNCDAQRLGFGTELWRGAFTSVRPSECGLTWNVDVSNTVFETCVDVLELGYYHYNCKGNPDQLRERILNDRFNGEIGASFLREYHGRKIKTQAGYKKKIMGFGEDSMSTFLLNQPNKPSRKITIKDYFKEIYNINIRYPRLPCIKINQTSRVPMEICRTEISPKKNLSPKETADMIRHTAINAEHRMEIVDKWIRQNNINNDPILKEYNVDLKMQMINLTGRVINAPDIEYNKQARTVVNSGTIGTKGSWDHRNFKFSCPNNARRWVVLVMARTYPDTVPKLANELIRIGKIHGMRLDQPLEVVNTGPRPNDRVIDQKFEQLARKYHSQQNPLDLMLIILSGTDAYKTIKTLGDMKYGIPTQVIDEKTAGKINPMTVSNILLKINMKLFGINFSIYQMNKLFTDYLKYLYGGKDDNLMIMGADVTHPSNNSNDRSPNSESIAAVTGSLDKECCYYAARLYAQRTPRGQAYELIHDLDKMVVDLILENQRRNRTFPSRIIFYRDGVSEGQFSLVLRHEINKIRAACQHVSPGYKPAITFVIVQKRHHTRFIPTNPRDYHGNNSNVPPGTVVDNTVVSENMFDYFLCSHSGIQGTSKPCRYFVLHDENNFSTDQMQLLSHYLCHVYSRCSKSVSYPAPAYYSHLAAFRGRCYHRKVPNDLDQQAVTSYEIKLHPNMTNRMFYI